MLNGSFMELYDSFLLHKTDANDTNYSKLFWNGQVIAKRSSLENWWTIRFLDDNNTLEDIVLISDGEGFYPATTQIGVLDTIKSRKVLEDGFILIHDATVNVTNLEIAETNKSHIKVINYTGTATLLNPILNFSKINWTTGVFPGQIKRVYTYDLTTTDSAGTAIANVSIVLLDGKGAPLFDLRSDADGTIPRQLITRSIFDYTFKSGDEQGPHTVKIKKYGKNFLSIAKEFSAATIETSQLSNNEFTTLNETAALAQTGINYTPPVQVAYTDAETEAVATDGLVLDNAPITQSEFFNLYNNSDGKKIASTEYTVDYATGNVTFKSSYAGTTVRAVYSYGGKIQIIGGKALSNIYDFMQANQSDVFTTATGSLYNSYVGIVLGNASDYGLIVQPTTNTLDFKKGFGWSAEEGTGATRNIDSSTWNFTWNAASNGTFSRRYTYDLKVTDTAGVGIENASVALTDLAGKAVFNVFTPSGWSIVQQNFTYVTYNSTTKGNATAVGPFTLKIRYFEKTFTEALKFLSAETSETVQLGAEPFVVGAGNSTGIVFTPPTNVSFGQEILTGCELNCTLPESPVTQSEYLVVYGWDGSNKEVKLTRVTDGPNANGEYNVTFATGRLDFFNNQSGYTVIPVYSYGGQILINETRTLSEIYDFVQANLSGVFTTATGTTYDSFVDMVLGDNVSSGVINETASRTVNFKEGFGWSAGSANGTAINVESDTWQFIWKPDNGTFFRQYTYDLKVTDTGGTAIGNVSVGMVDLHGAPVFDANTLGTGSIPTQTYTYGTYEFTDGNAITLVGPFTQKVKFYAKNFVEFFKVLTTKTSEETQLAANSFTTLANATAASNQSGINYTVPLKVTYASGETEEVATDGLVLDNVPITQSEFFNLYNNSDGKKIASTEYTVDYATGNVTFKSSYAGTTVRAVYSYGGKIQIIGGKALSNVYDFMQANQSDVFTTATGSIYNSYVDFILGNGTPSSNGRFIDDTEADWNLGVFLNTSTNSSGNVTLNQSGGEYDSVGNFTSQIFNTGNNATWINLTRGSLEPAGTNITFRVRSCNDADCDGEVLSDELTYPFTINTTVAPNSRYFQYQARFQTNDTAATPVLEWVNISYSTLAISGDKGVINESTTKTLDFKSGFGWSTTSSGGISRNVDSNTWNFVWRGPSNGTFNRQYSYDTTVKDTGGNAVVNTTSELLDIFGMSLFTDLTNSSGSIPTQTFTLYTYGPHTGSTPTSQGPFTLYLRKYGYKFVETQKVFSGKTSEEVSLETDSFVTEGVSAPEALAVAGIKYNEPIKVAYGEESNTSFGTSGQLRHFPITDSEYFALFRNGTKMFLGTDFSAFSCLSGEITFTSDETGNNITAVYSYGGNATLVNGLSDTRTIDELYDFLKANLFNGFNTLDGTAYISDINLVIGNASDTGSLASPTASLTYTCSRSSVFSSVGGFLDLLGTTVGGALSMRSQTGYSYSP